MRHNHGMQLEDFATRYGFDVSDTGGDIRQLLRSFSDGRYVIVTAPDGEMPSSFDAPCIAGLYNPDGELAEVRECRGLELALTAFS